MWKYIILHTCAHTLMDCMWHISGACDRVSENDDHFVKDFGTLQKFKFTFQASILVGL